ncbi:transporter substrate-binding domain-containing protein [Alteromonas sp. C1M14]|uniref:transporter substrate-binding domain-containing protein n=1 Tax=Alteromonas sp. C1M14 TaxID=2841567 RepID=UPI001C0852D4|nr:transporter substrate-binding domain-containing protein [Alteromonas sp. C1M14]MBU2978981.1 transporter substrate-binding domain-containing protein [Alteromonas sp. C1M14]
MVVRFLSVLCLVIIGTLVSGKAAAFAEEDVNKITYCIDPEWLPYEALRNGKHIGISADYLHIIEDLTKLNFELIPTESWQESLAALESGRCMMTTMINRTPSRSHFLDFSRPYMEVPNVLIGNENMPMVQGFDGVGNYLVGVVGGFRHAEYLAKYYPNIITEYVDSNVEGLERVSEGDLDLMVGSLLSLYAYINSHEISHLKIVGFAEPFDLLSFGVNKHYQYLIPILNDAIDTLPESKKVDIYRRWNSVQQVRETRYRTVLLIVFIGVGLIAILTWRKRVIRTYKLEIYEKNEEIEVLQTALLDKNRTLEFLSNRDELTGLYNRNYLMRKVEEEISRSQRFQTPCSLIGIEVLDSLSARLEKSVKEELYRQMARVCLSTVRDVDIAVRCESNRFVILCPQTQLFAAKKLALRLLKALSDELLNQTTLLIGVAELQSGQGFMEWNDDLNKAVVSSRRRGGNCVALTE